MFVAVLMMALLLAFAVVIRSSSIFNGLDLVIFILIVLLGAIALFRARKKDKEVAHGLPAEDELSKLIKYKSGYYTYLLSMYLWLFIFLR